MKIKLALFTCLIFLGLNLSAQESKFIEVTGSAEMLIEPDEFIFIIGIEEYWKEEFEKNKDFEDYKNKVKISEIEGQLIKTLNDLGIKTEDIKSTEVGNYWRYRGKELLISKKLEISLTDFKHINKIISKLDRKGIDYMQIGELKNKELVKYRKEVKVQALLAAKEKAKYLLEAIDKELGDIISITELNSDNYFWRPTLSTSNVMLNSSENPEAENDKKIKLRFEINAKFGIK
ncbi:SIMPL domain-containing protein [Gaetbulibacter jejuensis]|uniref:SIMPL domain-containing protein n=1 Tax=Gaetbulibacter jejuensis TaxID=584607 RepID=A0ABP3UL71_9FLAO